MRKSSAVLAAVLLASVSSTVLAQEPVHVPAIERAAAPADPGFHREDSSRAVPAAYEMPPKVQILSPSASLGPKERHAVRLVHRWRARRLMPAMGRYGYIRFRYGATMPTVVCAPLHLCDIALQPGEVVKSVNVGDPVMWDVEPSISGAGREVRTVLIVKPQDAGLRTDLSITTDRRIYAINLVSTRTHFMPLASFTYPDDQAREWADYRQQFSSAPPGTPAAAGNVYFPYTISGDDPPWRPLRVWSNGVKTFILFAPGFQRYQAGVPVLEAIIGGCGLCIFRSAPTATLNYRWSGQYIVYDGVLDVAELVTGAGASQTRVVLKRVGVN